MAKKPVDVVVLNTIQAAAADVVLASGKLQLNDGANDLLSEALRLTDGIKVVKTAYAAGTAQISTIDVSAVALLANSQYRISVEFSRLIGFNTVQVIADGGRAESNDLVPIREYVVTSGASAPTANELRDLFIARINGDAGKRVTAASGGAGTVQLTQDVLADGAFTMTAPSGAAIATGTPYVAPAGTPAIVEAVAPTKSSPTANYTTWTVDFRDFRRSNVVSGGSIFFPEFVSVYADSLAANYAAFATELDAVFAGTHTPASDYLGI